MAEYSLGEISGILHAELTGDGQRKIGSIMIDSRSLAAGPGSLFFAIRGERNDGHDYLPDSFEKGVRAFVVERMPPDLSRFPETGFLRVNDSLAALQNLAAAHRSRFDYPVIGITGSNGKTIVKEWAYQALSPGRHTVRSPKSYNSQVGVPLSIWQMDETHELGIFEAGISRPGEMKNLLKVIRPGIGIMTNIGEAHQQNFSGRKQKLREKLLLFESCHTIVYCMDQPMVDREIRRRFSGKNLFTWSESPEGKVIMGKISVRGGKPCLPVEYGGKRSEYILPFNDRASRENLKHLIALMLYLDVPADTVQERISSLNPVAMRLELLKGINGCTLINDAYNSDLVSLNVALDHLNQQNQHSRRTLILSDILQSGRNERDLYREVSEMISGKTDRVIGVGPSISGNRQFFGKDAVFFRDTPELMDRLPAIPFRDEAILIKGSRKFGFERLIFALEEKIHGTVLEIDLNAMVNNLNFYRSLVLPSTRIMAMVKAFSYGTGSHEIANLLQYHHVDYLGVAFVDEGIALRNAGINMPILVMNPDTSSFDHMIAYRLEPELYNFRSLEYFERTLKKHGTSYPVHLKLDTGMHRLGFGEEEIENLVRRIKSADWLEVRSVFSHLAASGQPEEDDFTRQQIRIFETMSNRVQSAFPYRILRHILNSAGIERFPGARFDMVRPGIGLYGVGSIHQKHLQPVGTLKSTISQVKKLGKGESVGYGRAARLARDSTVGVVPIGYADGLDRRFGNGKGRFLAGNERVPVIGNVCMDMCMVDLTGTEAGEGDEVIIFGRGQDISDLARSIGTIPYEILSGISSRVKRVYFRE